MQGSNHLFSCLLPNFHGYTHRVSITCVKYVYWVVPEKIHTSPTDGILEILVGGGVEDSGNPGGRGVDLKKVFCRGHFDR